MINACFSIPQMDFDKALKSTGLVPVNQDCLIVMKVLFGTLYHTRGSLSAFSLIRGSLLRHIYFHLQQNNTEKQTNCNGKKEIQHGPQKSKLYHCQILYIFIRS